MPLFSYLRLGTDYMRAFLLCLALPMSFALISPVHAYCKTTRFHFAFGLSEDQASSRVDRQGTCNFSLRAGYTGQARPMSEIKSLAVATPPAHGSVNILSNYHFTYEPNRNYVGHDAYSVVINFQVGTALGATRVNYNVDVVDKIPCREFLDFCDADRGRTSAQCQGHCQGAAALRSPWWPGSQEDEEN
jgi:hypothetical protein